MILYNFNELGFRSRIEPSDDGCWIWHGAVDKDGYGTFTYGCTSRPAHRLAYQYFKDVLLEKDVAVKRSCGNRLCVNPDHLYIGPKNHSKGKSKPYERTGYKKKLTQDQVNKLFRAIKDAQEEQAGVSKTTVWKAKNGLL